MRRRSFPVSQPAVTINRQAATDFIDGLVADGGTEMRGAPELRVRHAADAGRAPPDRCSSPTAA